MVENLTGPLQGVVQSHLIPNGVYSHRVRHGASDARAEGEKCGNKKTSCSSSQTSIYFLINGFWLLISLLTTSPSNFTLVAVDINFTAHNHLVGTRISSKAKHWRGEEHIISIRPSGLRISVISTFERNKHQNKFLYAIA